MSRPLVITLSHKLGKEEALQRIKPALNKASGSFPVLKVEEEIWSGDRLDFRVRALETIPRSQVADVAGTLDTSSNREGGLE